MRRECIHRSRAMDGHAAEVTEAEPERSVARELKSKGRLQAGGTEAVGLQGSLGTRDGGVSGVSVLLKRTPQVRPGGRG